MVRPLLERVLNPNLSGLLRQLRSLHGDRGYGFDFTINQVKAMGVEPVLCQRDEPINLHPSGLGIIRRVVEQTLANIGHCRRIKFCYEKIGAHFQAFNELAAALLCCRRIEYYQRL
jgi:hypothetical protein